MKKTFILGALLLVSLVVSAQVSFSAHVFLPTNEPLDYFFPFYLKVDSEDTVRFQFDSTASVRFDNIAIGSRCHLTYDDVVGSYDYPVFTITEDTYIDSLVLRRIPREKEWFSTKFQKDSTFNSRAIHWSHDVDGYDTLWYENHSWLDKEPHSLKLARLYYSDWIAPLASWRTWPHAADSAYRYCLHASKQHPYLYYPLRQLAQYFGKRTEMKPPKEPDEYTYFPQPEMPEDWWMDTTVNLFSLWEQHEQENIRARNHTLGIAYEKSLCYPIATDGTMRLMILDPLGWGVIIYRVEGEQIYRKRISAYGDELKDNEFYTLTDDELDSVSMTVEAFHRAERPDDESGPYVIDGCSFMLEYIINGKYHRYTTSSGAIPPQLKAIMGLLWNILFWGAIIWIWTHQGKERRRREQSARRRSSGYFRDAMLESFERAGYRLAQMLAEEIAKGGKGKRSRGKVEFYGPLRLVRRGSTAAPSGTVQLTGRTPCDRIVVFNGLPELAGTFQRVKIVETAPFTLFGEIITK